MGRIEFAVLQDALTEVINLLQDLLKVFAEVDRRIMLALLERAQRMQVMMLLERGYSHVLLTCQSAA